MYFGAHVKSLTQSTCRPSHASESPLVSAQSFAKPPLREHVAFTCAITASRVTARFTRST